MNSGRHIVGRSAGRRIVTGHIVGRATGLVLAVVAALAAGVLAAQPAAAHARLQKTSPAAGAAVGSAPDEVVLTFNEPPIGIGSVVRVIGPGDRVVSVGPVRVVDEEVHQTLEAGLPKGGYQVEWRVTSDDGHPVSDRFTFTVGGALSPSAPSGSASTATATASATTTASTPSSTTAPTATAVGAPDGSDSGSAPPWAVVAAIGAAVLVLALLLLLVLSHTRNPRSSA